MKTIHIDPTVQAGAEVRPGWLLFMRGLTRENARRIAREEGGRAVSTSGYCGFTNWAVIVRKPDDLAAQRAIVEQFVELARQSGEPVTLYRNKQGDVLVATEYDKGLARSVIKRCGSWDYLGAGPVDLKRWTPIDKPDQGRFRLKSNKQKPAFWKGPPKQKPPVQKTFLSGIDLDPRTQELFDTEGIPQESEHDCQSHFAAPG